MSNIILSFWTNIQARNWGGVENLLDRDLVFFLPQSGEQFNLFGFIRLNQEYPGNWNIEVLSINEMNGNFISEIRVITDQRVEWGISFFEIKNCKIYKIKEYWAEPFDAPYWRRNLAISTDKK